ncbi:hypothetical protein [Cryobacterium sp. Sr8]|uniref:hypothetical protein n=1 Tax=Cryobacterium sp. Sr8 TaxID=1259203 RepID=UPI003511F8A4
MPFAISTAHQGDGGFAAGLLLRVGFDLVADERGDRAEVEVCQQHRHDDLGGFKSSHSTPTGGFDVLGAASLDGAIDHRDVFYSERQQHAAQKMCCCVSRAVTSPTGLDADASCRGPAIVTIGVS